MSVKAKFTCNAVVPSAWNTKCTVVYFNAVFGKEGDNADYAKATPSGQLNMVIDENTPAASFFEQGKNYYLTFETAEE